MYTIEYYNSGHVCKDVNNQHVSKSQFGETIYYYSTEQTFEWMESTV